MSVATSGQRRAAGHPPLGPAVFDALDRARAALQEASNEETAARRYATAHVAALRASAAVLAARPGSRSSRGSRSAWSLLGRAEPALEDWAAYFAAGAAKRAASEADLPGAATEAEAEELITAVGEFLEVIEHLLGLLPGSTRQQRGHALPGQPVIPGQSVPRRAESLRGVPRAS